VRSPFEIVMCGGGWMYSDLRIGERGEKAPVELFIGVEGGVGVAGLCLGDAWAMMLSMSPMLEA
jgi:hypothetical protein